MKANESPFIEVALEPSMVPPLKAELPYPGDGVSPTSDQFWEAYSSSFDFWTSLISTARCDPSIPSIVDSLLDLLRRIPAFRINSSTAFMIINEPYPQVKFALEWTTTTDPGCEQPVKRTYHYQQIARPQPLTCRFTTCADASAYWPGIPAERNGYLSYLILGWAFLLSSRWAELLRDSGKPTLLCHRADIDEGNFWQVVADRPWQAGIIQGDKAFSAPWSLMKDGSVSQAQLHPLRTHSSSAFKIFAGSCRSKGLMEECFAALAIVLMLPKYTEGTEIELFELGAPPPSSPAMDYQDDCYTALYDNLERCITLSCSFEGIDSLLCGTFFEASIPCNLVGAYNLGVSRALESVQTDRWTFTALMARRNPLLSPLWQAAIWTDQWKNALSSVMGGLPPINLAVASWTDTLQSFVQVDYNSMTDRADSLPRAREFSCVYMVSPITILPFTPSPPFGEVAVSNTNLDVRAHLLHCHVPLRHRTYWILHGGDELLTHSAIFQRRRGVCLPPIAQSADTDTVCLPSIAQPADTDAVCLDQLVEDANDCSECATYNLYRWYSSNEGGLWLAEGQEDVGMTIQRNSHPWIFRKSGEENSCGDTRSDKEIDIDGILKWLDKVIVPSPSISAAPLRT